MKPFTLFYTFLSALLYLLALVPLLWLISKPKYRKSIPARFFLRANPPFKRKGVWFHVCSLGEARALKPVLGQLNGYPINITVITQTGYHESKKYGAQVRYLPYEMFLPFWITRQPLLVVLEAEFWYLLFAAARAKGAKVVLLNARMTEKSYPKYRRLKWFYSRLFDRVDKIFCQSEADRQRFESLGAGNIEVIGNIKLAQKVTTTALYDKPEGEVIVAASTHDGEEYAIIKAFLNYRRQKSSKLIIVPRHPERFGTVWKLITENAKELNFSRWSVAKTFDSDIILVDAMGELNNMYAISDIAILGGAFRDDVGGHNPLEPAHFGCKIITGKHAYMQQELFKYVSNVQKVDTDSIEEALARCSTMESSQIMERIDLERVVDYLKENYN
ncbi:MAG: 3-deoxy-D-manno-octulosonic acid transferase [Helicobacteraceae bacterium 4484_230]|nr:MAG: 3-deoxy-D-manno-octulosonic acid transferase [Helicobacteraceae bacterium 4484_230]